MIRFAQRGFWQVRKMSDHSDFKQFLDSLGIMLDNISDLLYTARCRIRVEQRIVDHAESPKKVSDPTESDAPSSEIRQGGPQPHVQGTPREIARSQKAAEKFIVKCGRMEIDHGRP